MSKVTQVSCHFPHKCPGSQCPHKRHVIIHAGVTSLYTQASCQYPNKRHVIIQTSVPNKRHIIIQTSVVIIQTNVASLSKQDKRLDFIQTSVTSLSKQAPKPLYWHIPPNWYSRYEHVHPYKLFTECTRVNHCTSVNPCCNTADSFTRLLPTQCWVENRIALPHTLFHLATVKDRNRLAWCDLHFYFTRARPWAKSRLHWWNANNNNRGFQ